MKISVIIPVKDEAENIDGLFREIKTALDDVDNLEYEIIFVDDGSKDQTPDILQKLTATAASLRVLHHAFTCGQSTAIFSGVLHATNDYMLILDGDGQNDPVDLPKMIQLFKNADPDGKLGLVIGNRTNRQDSFTRKIVSKIANSVRGMLLNDATPDSGCGLKMLPRSLFLRLPFFDHMHRFMPALVMREGFQVKSIPVRHRHRRAGISKYGIHNRLWVGITDLFGVMWLIRRMQKPTVTDMTTTSTSNQK